MAQPPAPLRGLATTPLPLLSARLLTVLAALAALLGTGPALAAAPAAAGGSSVAPSAAAGTAVRTARPPAGPVRAGAPVERPAALLRDALGAPVPSAGTGPADVPGSAATPLVALPVAALPRPPTSPYAERALGGPSGRAPPGPAGP